MRLDGLTNGWIDDDRRVVGQMDEWILCESPFYLFIYPLIHHGLFLCLFD